MKMHKCCYLDPVEIVNTKTIVKNMCHANGSHTSTKKILRFTLEYKCHNSQTRRQKKKLWVGKRLCEKFENKSFDSIGTCSNDNTDSRSKRSNVAGAGAHISPIYYFITFHRHLAVQARKFRHRFVIRSYDEIYVHLFSSYVVRHEYQQCSCRYPLWLPHEAAEGIEAMLRYRCNPRFYCSTKIRKNVISNPMQSGAYFSICSRCFAMEISNMTYRWKIATHCWCSYIISFLYESQLFQYNRTKKWDLYCCVDGIQPSQLLLLLISIVGIPALHSCCLFDIDWYWLSSASCHLYRVDDIRPV